MLEEVTVNPTYPANRKQIKEITFEQVKQQTKNILSPPVSREPAQAPWFSFSDILDDCGVDKIV